MFHGHIFFYRIPVLHCGERKLVGVQLVGDFDTLKRDKRIKASRETIAAALVDNILPALPSNQAYFIPATGPHPLNHWSAGLTGSISHGKDLKRLDRERSGSFQPKK